MYVSKHREDAINMLTSGGGSSLKYVGRHGIVSRNESKNDILVNNVKITGNCLEKYLYNSCKLSVHLNNIVNIHNDCKTTKKITPHKFVK